MNKNVIQSTTTRAVGLAALVVGGITWVLREYLNLELDQNAQNALTVVIVAVLTPLLSRLLKQLGLPGLSSIALLLIPAFMLTGCATNRGTFAEYDPTTGAKIYEGDVYARAGWGGSIEEAQGNAVWSNDVNPDGTTTWDLTLSQTSAGLASPDIGAQVAAGVTQALNTYFGAQVELAGIGAQGNRNLQALLEFLAQPQVLDAIARLAFGDNTIVDLPEITVPGD